jgi:hypothetical protein
VTLSILSDDAIDSFRIQILMKVVISNTIYLYGFIFSYGCEILELDLTLSSIFSSGSLVTHEGRKRSIVEMYSHINVIG